MKGKFVIMMRVNWQNEPSEIALKLTFLKKGKLLENCVENSLTMSIGNLFESFSIICTRILLQNRKTSLKAKVPLFFNEYEKPSSKGKQSGLINERIRLVKRTH
jgi:hypothetical protein